MKIRLKDSYPFDFATLTSEKGGLVTLYKQYVEVEDGVARDLLERYPKIVETTKTVESAPKKTTKKTESSKKTTKSKNKVRR